MRSEYASRLVARWVVDNAAPPWRALRGTAVLADLSGFTRLTEQLAHTAGDEGAELLHEVITTCFDAVLSTSVALGGDIIGFAGDAALVWFDSDDHPDHVDRSVEAARSMLYGLRSLPASLTAGRRLRVSIGVHTGTATAVLAGSARRELFLCGPDVSLVTALQGAAGANQILASAALAAMLPPRACGDVVGPGIALRGLPPPLNTAVGASRGGRQVPAPTDAAAMVLSPDVLELLDSGDLGGDHRTVSVGFVRVPGTDALLTTSGPETLHAALSEVVDLVDRIGAEESVTVLGTDVGSDSVRLLLTCGAPRAVEHDEDRLLRTMWRIVAESGRPVAAGAQRGRVFAGLLGVEQRRSYTVLGDAVNVAARALSLAADGELVVGDGLAVTSRPFVEAAPLGPQSLKNRVQPVEMWRVTRVHARVVRRRGVGFGVTARPAEVASLRAAWKRTVDGIGASVLLVGEPGMGASDLLDDLVDLAGGAATALVPDPSRMHTPYAAIEAIVTALATDAGLEVSTAADAWRWLATHRATLNEPLRGWAPAALSIAARAGSGGVDARMAGQRARAVLAALVAVAAPRPWLLAVDDLHLVDDASRQVLVQLRDLMAAEAVLFVGSCEPDDVATVRLGPRDVEVPLPALDETAATDLVTVLAPALRDDVIDRIVAAAAGNPFVLAELAARPDTGELPDGLQRMASWLVDSLPPRVRRHVREAAVFGRRFTLPLVADVVGSAGLADERAWTEAGRLVRQVDGTTMAFRHDAFRHAAYRSLPFRRRRELHSALADRLAAGSEPDEAVLAEHLELAGRGREAYPHAVRAGQMAKSTGALAEAVDLLARAARLAHRHEAAAEAQLLVEEGEARVWLSDLDGADRCFRAAARLNATPMVIGRLCHLRADLALSRGDAKGCKRWAEQGLAATASLGPEAAELRCFLLLDLAARRLMVGDDAGGAALSHEALDRAREAGSRVMEGLAHLHLEMAVGLADEARIRHHGDEAIRIFEEIGHDRYLQYALTNSGLTLMYLGDWDGAITRYRTALDGLERLGHASAKATTLANIGFLRLRQGHLDEADELGRRALRLLEAAGLDHSAGVARLLRAEVAAREGRWDDAGRLVDDARRGFTAVGDDAMVVDCDVTTLCHLGMRGMHHTVVELAPATRRRLAHAEAETRVAFERVLATALAATGDNDGLEHLHRALAAARDGHLLYEVWCCLTALGDLTGDAGTRAEREALARRLGIHTAG
jgi:class 3 adenylate cyclase/tetratricopeptide (TPR) repeat protein